MASTPRFRSEDSRVGDSIMVADSALYLPGTGSPNGEQAAPTATGNVAADGATRSSTYVPQFAESAQLILSRIHGMSDNSKPIIGDEASSGMGMRHDSSRGEEKSVSADDSTIPLPTCMVSSQTYQDQIAAVSSCLKRKRGLDSEVPDFTQSTISFPATLSPRPPVVTPLHSSAHLSNDDPKAALQSSKQPLSHSQATSIETDRQQIMFPLAGDITPAKPELVGYYAGQASDLVRTQYFMQKKRTDLLNILSFCDQLHPQLLADIMVSVSKRHPDLPIFDSPDWAKSVHRSSELQLASDFQGGRPAGKPRHGHTLLNPKARQRQKHEKKGLKRLILTQNGEGIPAAEEEKHGEKEVLPPTWPKAGKGLYSDLPPETDDRTFLTDDNDDESFSQFMVDSLGKPTITVSACA
ncbi:hypothetical protein QQS21_009174 [Conoideocrella luteorostrata]|uniref:Uncharacterized protein n=1 Tax=Conoideocrella luteorostrata TaxID=1105319 RepID=A0AAJ0CHQ4_9HYPO|nr:hypothetical protein QQS21_009174 [Conoideocrella luteorostrata]